LTTKTKRAKARITLTVILISLLCSGLYLGLASLQATSAETPASHRLIFTQTGLAPNTYWAVIVNGILLSSTTDTITVDCQSGSTYSYTIQVPAGYTTKQQTVGYVAMADSDVSLPTIVFYSTHRVTFIEQV
jgi:hypothetical protein